MTLQEMKKRFRYDPISGDLFLKITSKIWIARLGGISEKKVDCIIGGYLVVNTKESKRPLLAHRVAYQIYHDIELTDLIVDHIDQDKLNNKIENLIATTRAINNKNLALRKTNKSGYSNVYQLPSGKWRAQIRVNKKSIHLGCFDTIEEAAAAKRKANADYGFSEFHN